MSGIIYGTQTILSVASLQSLGNSATAGWQSQAISNTSTRAVDYEVFVKLTTANTGPASPQLAYVYVSPWYYDSTNNVWYCTDGGTGTLLSGNGTATLPSTDAAYTIAATNDLVLLGVLNYTTQQMVMQRNFMLSNVLTNMPEAFSFVIINNTGAALSTGCIVDVKPLTLG
jgi:hypothetical protein